MKNVSETSRKKKYLFWAQFLVILIALLIALFALPFNQGPLRVSHTTISPGPYVTFNLTNNQSVPTSSNFDQLIQVVWAEFRNYLNSNLSNVVFYNSTKFSDSDRLYAWAEEYDPGTALSDKVWVNLSDNIIPAYGFLHIYMRFLNKSNSSDGYFGMPPSIGYALGAIDDGSHVFPFYDNFNRPNLSVLWQQFDFGGGSVTASRDGLNIIYPYSSFASIITVRSYAYPKIFEVQETIYAQSGGAGAQPTEAITNQTGFAIQYWDGGFLESYVYQVNLGTDYLSVVDQNFSKNIITPNSAGGNFIVRGIEWNDTGSIEGLIDDTYRGALNSTDATWQVGNYHFALIAGTGFSSSGSSLVHWVRARNPPPNNVMPEVHVDSVPALDFPVSL